MHNPQKNTDSPYSETQAEEKFITLIKVLYRDNCKHNFNLKHFIRVIQHMRMYLQ